jgi:hypothetical protein
MVVEALHYVEQNWEKIDGSNHFLDADIVFTFGDRETFKCPETYDRLRQCYPNAEIVGCSSSGNILGDQLSDATMVANAISFEEGSVKVSIEDFTTESNLQEMTHQLISRLPKEDLKHVFILSDGLNVNGSSLAKGANQALDYAIPITGGLAGDGSAFEETYVIANESAKQNRVVAIGFYGGTLEIKSGCFGGWSEFGVSRTITKSKENIVYEIDNQPALALYKKYLGEDAKELPGSELRFPINIRKNEEDTPVVRTLLGVDEENQSLTFAGDVPEGFLAHLMKSNIDEIIGGAETAAQQVYNVNNKTALGLVVSCVGRRLVLKELTDEELEGVSSILGENVSLVGFYSYGELAPLSDEIFSCQLHNQTLTLTVIYE